MKPSQLRRLQKRAAARAEQITVAAAEQARNDTETQNTESNNAVAEEVKSAEPAEKARDGILKAKEAKVELDKAQTEPDESDGPLVRARYEHAKFCNIPVEPYGLAHARACDEYNRKNGPFRCSFCRIPFQTREKFKEHQKEDWAEKTKCNMCGHKLNCRALKKHMENTHEKEIDWVVQEYNK